MKIFYTKNFLTKLSIENYPIKGFWYQLVNSNGKGNIKQNWRSSGSDIYASNTFKYEDKFRVNIKLTQQNDIHNKNNCIYLYGLDLLHYSDITELTSSTLTIRNVELLSQLAGIIQLDCNPDWSINNIFDIPVPVSTKVTCYFECTADIHSDNVQHYQNESIGNRNFYSATEDQLIDYESGQRRLREVKSRYRPDQLLGTMTIKDSGIIQL